MSSPVSLAATAPMTPCCTRESALTRLFALAQVCQDFLHPLSPSLLFHQFSSVYLSLSHSNFTHSCTSTHHTCFSFLFSSATCSGGKEWQDCGTACPPTCDNYNTTIICTTQCVSGCFCPEGMVDHNGECVDPSACPGMPTEVYLYPFLHFTLSLSLS